MLGVMKLSELQLNALPIFSSEAKSAEFFKYESKGRPEHGSGASLVMNLLRHDKEMQQRGERLDLLVDLDVNALKAMKRQQDAGEKGAFPTLKTISPRVLHPYAGIAFEPFYRSYMDARLHVNDPLVDPSKPVPIPRGSWVIAANAPTLQQFYTDNRTFEEAKEMESETVNGKRVNRWVLYTSFDLTLSTRESFAAKIGADVYSLYY